MVSLLHRFYTKEYLAAIAPDSSYNNKNTAILGIADILHDQIKRNSSHARIKMFGDIHVTQAGRLGCSTKKYRSMVIIYWKLAAIKNLHDSPRLVNQL
jgi:hypothetical protein